MILCERWAEPLYVCHFTRPIHRTHEFLQMNPEDRKMLPKLAFMGFASRFEEPTVGEGFEDVTVVDFVVSRQLLGLSYRTPSSSFCADRAFPTVHRDRGRARGLEQVLDMMLSPD